MGTVHAPMENRHPGNLLAGIQVFPMREPGSRPNSMPGRQRLLQYLKVRIVLGAWVVKIIFLSFSLSVFGTLQASSRRPTEPPIKSTAVSTVTTIKSSDPEPPPPELKDLPKETPQMPAEGWSSLSVFLVLHPNGEPEKVVKFLQDHPELKVTLIFPPHYFTDPARRPFIAPFRILQSSQNIEIGLSLDSEPMLPLLNDLGTAGEKVRKWGFTFAWPEDVAAQIARGSAKYQKRWGSLPNGLMPPYLSLTEPVVKTLQKFRLNWVLGHPSDVWGVRFFGGTALIISPKPPVIDELTLGGKVWADQMAVWSLNYPFVLIDTSPLEDPNADKLFLESLVKKLATKSPASPLMTGEVMLETLKDELDLDNNEDPFKNDYSDWVSKPRQKRGWAALAEARKVIDTYQRSGRANLQRLDAAVEEMCNAESGDFLLNLGSEDSKEGPLIERPASERNFLATVGNIYRLCETPVPANLNTWFEVRTSQKASSKPTQTEGPFFVEGPNSLTWNDRKGDDNGAGDYTYPVGSYPKGMFDLGELTISWNDTDVTITAGVQEEFLSKPTPIIPMLDLYIDVNRLSNAGSTTPLKKRGNTILMPEASWEYALTLSANGATLLQLVPGDNPRIISRQDVDVQGKNFSVTFPRNQLRGDPKHWRLSAGLLGIDNNRRQEDPIPVSILTNATEKNFGGAGAGQVAPYIDLLDSSPEDQESRIKFNIQGGPLTLPFVESQ